MILKTIFDHDTIVIDRSVDSKSAALRKIAEIVVSSGVTGDDVNVDTITGALEEREILGSTGFGHGVAIPHCRLLNINDFRVGFILVPDGMDFNAIDGDDVYFLPFVVGPSDRPKEHLAVLSSLAQLMRIPEIKKELLEAEGKDDVKDIFRRYIFADEDASVAKTVGMKLITVFIQNESLFDEILQVFSVIESTYAMVIEAHESTDYLRNMSLFAGFWNMDVQHFNRIIVAVVRDELVNSTIRNIEYICGDLSSRDDVLLTITALQKVLGSLCH